MNRLRAVAILASAAGLALLAGGPAGAARWEAELRIEAVDARAFPAIEVLVTPPASLYGSVPDAVVLLENGRIRPATVSLLAAQPLQVLLVVDTSGSMRGAPLEAAKAAAAEFLAALPPTTRTAVMGFAAVPGEAGSFSEDPTDAAADLGRLQAGGETALYDAVTAALDAIEAEGRGRPFIVLLSDGGDTASGLALADAVERLQASAVRFYAVELQTEESDPASLQALAEVGAGRVVPAADPAGLAAVYDLIAAELVNQLVVGYTSASGGPTDLTITVAHRGVSVTAAASITLPGSPVTPSTTTPASTTTRPDARDPAGPTTVAAAAPLPSFVAPGPGLLGSGWVLPTGLAAAFLAVLTVMLLALAPDGGHGVVADIGPARERFSPAGGMLTRVTNRAKGAAEAALSRRGRQSALSRTLDSAGIRLAAGEFLVLNISAIIAGTAVGGLLLRLPGAVVVGILALVVPRLLVNRSCRKRREAFATQLDGTLQLLAGSLRAGYGLMQAVNNIAAEAAAPTGREFARIVVETRLGRDLAESLAALAQRMDSPDFRWVTQAIEIQRSVGGDLAQILDTVGQTIRERNQIRRQIKALSAEGRISSYILIAIPIFLAAFILVMAPEFIAPLWTTTMGLIAVGVGVALMLVGIAWIRRLVRLRF